MAHLDGEAEREGRGGKWVEGRVDEREDGCMHAWMDLRIMPLRNATSIFV